jgi:hypothetical protein
MSGQYAIGPKRQLMPNLTSEMVCSTVGYSF